MEPQKAVIASAFYIRALELTPEEKTQHRAKFEAWYADFKRQHQNQMPTREEQGQHEANYQNWLGEIQEKHPNPNRHVGC